MEMTVKIVPAVLALLLLLNLSGCTSKTTPIDTQSTANSDNHEGHDHHDHDHETLGPNGGHVLELGDHQYHAEWTHDDETKEIVVYVLDKGIKQPVQAAADGAKITVAIEKQGAKNYVLEAVEANEEEPPTATKFRIIDSNLLTSIKMGKGVYATLSVVIDGTEFTTKIEHHAHGHHHH